MKDLSQIRWGKKNLMKIFFLSKRATALTGKEFLIIKFDDLELRVQVFI